jgi:hypothetical protein
LKSTYTQGPWKVEKTDRNIYIKYEKNQAGMGQPIAECFSPDVYANARLIAAAPELLEAAVVAQMILFHIAPVQVDESFDEGKAMLEKAQALLLAAITKARN